MPGGLDRAVRQGRLPEDAEGYMTDTETWVPLAEHPAVTAALSSARPAADTGDFVLLDPNQVDFLVQARELERRSRRSGPVRVSEATLQQQEEKDRERPSGAVIFLPFSDGPPPSSLTGFPLAPLLREPYTFIWHLLHPWLRVPLVTRSSESRSAFLLLQLQSRV